jgi:hypothetical protein
VGLVLDEIEQGSHIVHFYADDFELAASIARYAADGLDAGQAVVVIAKPAHLASVRDALVAIGVDPDSGNVHLFDASATLGQFMKDGLLDRDRFSELVGGTLRAAASGRSGVRAYGEMVEILWQRGDVTGALALEGLWNGLARELSFSLYCAYRQDVVAQGVKARWTRRAGSTPPWSRTGRSGRGRVRPRTSTRASMPPPARGSSSSESSGTRRRPSSPASPR